MKTLNVLSVCGSGSVTSSMVSNKVTEILESEGFRVNATECNPNGVDALLQSRNVDLIVNTSPLNKDYDIPTINAIPLLTGVGKQKFVDTLITQAKAL